MPTVTATGIGRFHLNRGACSMDRDADRSRTRGGPDPDGAAPEPPKPARPSVTPTTPRPTFGAGAESHRSPPASRMPARAGLTKPETHIASEAGGRADPTPARVRPGPEVEVGDGTRG